MYCTVGADFNNVTPIIYIKALNLTNNIIKALDKSFMKITLYNVKNS